VVLITKLVGFPGSHESRQLKWGDLTLVTNADVFSERFTKTRNGNRSHEKPFASLIKWMTKRGALLKYICCTNQTGLKRD